jgi:hypothetical protein
VDKAAPVPAEQSEPLKQKPVQGQDDAGYTARIEAANSVLVQAMASFGAASRMMTSTGLAPSTSSTIEPWMTVSALPSVTRLVTAG